MLAVVAVAGAFLTNEQKVTAGAADNIFGFAWSGSAGWFSFNSTDCDADNNGFGDDPITRAGCPDSTTAIPSYGVRLDVDKYLKGYAWNGILGWVKFGEFPPGVFPVGGGTVSDNAHVDGGGVKGWARVCNRSIVGSDCLTSANASILNVSCGGDPIVGRADNDLESNINRYPDSYFKWSAYISGGVAPYTTSWSGDVTGSNQTQPAEYTVTGDILRYDVVKTANVSVTSSDGQNAAATCKVRLVSQFYLDQHPTDGLVVPSEPYSALPDTVPNSGDYCPFLTQPGRIIFPFYETDALVSDSDDLPVAYHGANVLPASIPAGYYTVRLFGWDGSDARGVPEASEPHERWRLEFGNDNPNPQLFNRLAISASTPDLANGRAASFSGIVDQSLYIPPGISHVRAFHSRVYELGGLDFKKPNTLYPWCAALDPGPVPSASTLWDGWLSFSGNNYGGSINPQNELGGFAWGANMVGWVGLDGVTLFNPYTYEVNVPTTPFSVLKGGTVSIPVTGLFSEPVASATYIDLLVDNQTELAGILAPQGLLRCTNSSGDDTCAGTLNFAVDASAPTGGVSVLLSADPEPTNPPNDRTASIFILPDYTLAPSSSNFDVPSGSSLNVRVTATFEAPLPAGTSFPVISAQSSNTNYVTVPGIDQCDENNLNGDRTQCDYFVTVHGVNQTINGQTITVTGTPGGVTTEFTVDVISPAVTVQLTVSPYGTPSVVDEGVLVIPNGGSVCLTWNTTNADSCVTTGGISLWPDSSLVPLNSSACNSFIDDPPTGPATLFTLSGQTPTFTLECINQAYQTSDSETVRAIPPTVALKGNGVAGALSVPIGSKAKITWNLFFVGSVACRPSGPPPGDSNASWKNLTINGSVDFATGEHITKPIFQTTTFTLTCGGGATPPTDTLIVTPLKGGFREI